MNIFLLYGESILVVLPWRRRRPTQRSGAELLVYIYIDKANILIDMGISLEFLKSEQN